MRARHLCIILNYCSHNETLIFIIYSKTYFARPAITSNITAKNHFALKACVSCWSRHSSKIPDFIFLPMARCVSLRVHICPFLILFFFYQFSHLFYFIVPICFKNSAALTAAFCGRLGEFQAVSKLSSRYASFLIVFYFILTYFSFIYL
jgi:hypothetical protein